MELDLKSDHYAFFTHRELSRRKPEGGIKSRSVPVPYHGADHQAETHSRAAYGLGENTALILASLSP